MMSIKTKNIYISYNHIDQYFKDKLDKIIGNKYHIKSSPQEYSIKNNFNKYLEQLESEDEDIVIVLMGTDTYKTKSVNWDIEYGLSHDSCIIGLCLPTNDDYRKKTVNTNKLPMKFVNNLYTGYASYFDWTDNIDELEKYISITYNQKMNKHAIMF